MPLENNWSHILTVLDYEKMLRTQKIILKFESIKCLDLPEYWRQVLMLFSIYQGLVYRDTIDEEIFYNLYPSYQYLLHNKWLVKTNI
jgi:thymidylate synthase